VKGVFSCLDLPLREFNSALEGVFPHPVSAPQLVEVQIERTDRGAWINTLRIVEGSLPTSLPTLTTRDREIRRLACLQAGVTFAAGKCLGGTVDIKTADVLKVAEAFEKWVLAPNQEELP